MKGGPPETALDNKLKIPYPKISGYEMLNVALESVFFGGDLAEDGDKCWAVAETVVNVRVA